MPQAQQLPPLNWADKKHAALANRYLPVPQLASASMSSKEVQQKLNDGGAVTFKVENEQFSVPGVEGQTPRQIKGVPDMEITVEKGHDGKPTARLTDDTNKRLTAIAKGEQTVDQNIGLNQMNRPFGMGRKPTLNNDHELRLRGPSL